MFASGKTASASSGASSANYIEDVFSTYLFETNTPSDVTVPNGIDLSGKGGLVWNKCRNDSFSHQLYDTNRGGSYQLQSNTTNAQSSYFAGRVEFGSDGFVWKSSGGWSTNSFTSWTFRKQPKFFDVVTYTGNGVNGRAISHNLGSTPGFIVVKCTSSAAQWVCWHRAYNSGNGYGYLNDTTAWFNTGADVWGNGTTYTAPTSTTFTVNGDSVGNMMNGTGDTYVAYIYAHNAGGFGLTGTDNVISCGSVTTNSLGLATVELGYEPQWILYKSSAADGNWNVMDNMRGLPARYQNQGGKLFPNLSNAETNSDNLGISATGFTLNTNANEATIYIAIRRGPMKVPTSGTSVFYPLARTGTGSTANITGVGFAPDLVMAATRDQTAQRTEMDRLRGVSTYLTLSTTAAETTSTNAITAFNNNGITVGADTSAGNYNYSTWQNVNWFFGRAPSFFDEVCYTGTGVARTLNHNLGAVPELMIVKRRDGTSYGDWLVYHASLGNTKYLLLNTSDASATANSGAWNFTNPTSTQFTVGDWESLNTTATYVAYLFATCAGVSKVGSYTGTGTTKQIDCGFTGGARFVLIKRTDSTGDWYVWDSARGIVSGNDPYLLLNSTAAETTGTDYIDTYSAGFEISSTAPAAINASGGTFIFLAIA